MNTAEPYKTVLGSEEHRKWVGALVAKYPSGYVLRIDPPKRKLVQNALLHACLTDLHEQAEWYGKRFSVLTWKRLCTASWLREKGEQPELIPALDGNGFDIVFEKTSEMSVTQIAELIDWIYAFGAQNGVTFKEVASAA